MERTGIGKIVMSFLTEPSYEYDKNFDSNLKLFTDLN